MNRDDVMMENELLTKVDVMGFDIERTKFLIFNFMKHYKILKCKSFSEPHIKVTATYKYIYVDETHRSNNSYTEIDRLIDAKTEYYELSSKITLFTSILTEEEKVYFTVCLYNGLSESSAVKEIGCSNKGLLKIKNSCLIKFGSAFDLCVLNGNKLSDDQELQFLQYA